MDLSARIKNLRIEPAIMNASGVFSFLPVLRKLADFRIGALVAKSVCTEERQGFDNPIFASSCDTHINAVGLPGPGVLH